MTGLIIKILFGPGGMVTPHDDRYVVTWNADTEFGVLEVTSTDDPLKAFVFESPQEALSHWGHVSKVQPLRPDGLPNKPLSGLTLQAEPAPDQPEEDHRTADKIDGYDRDDLGESPDY